jgi:hypothetical protein
MWGAAQTFPTYIMSDKLIALSELEDFAITNVLRRDYPDFCDAHVEWATWGDGTVLQGELLTEEELALIDPEDIQHHIHEKQLWL